MPRHKDISISAMMDPASDEYASASEDNLDPTADSSIENIEPPKKARGRPAAASSKSGPSTKTAVAKAKTAATSAAKKTNPTKRAALREQKNERIAAKTEDPEISEEEDTDLLGNPEPKAPERKSKPSNAPAKAPAKRGRPPKTKPENTAREVVKSKKNVELPSLEEGLDEEDQEPPQKTKGKKPANSKPMKRQTSVELGTADNTLEPDDEDNLMLVEDEQTHEPSTHPMARKTSRARSTSKTRPPSVSRRRGASASDTERTNGGSDPAIRRKLGEMTKKFQNLDLKYRNLREVGVKEAESNFDRLRRQTEERTETSNKFITSLRNELATQTSLAKESRSLQKQLSSKDDEVSKLQAQVAQLNTSLLEARNESKSLSAKLAANRATPAPTHGADAFRASAGAAKNASRAAPGGTAEAAQAWQVAQLKEDLYSDLTGLILRGVKSSEGADVYDCIQTGRNGTLHFKLSIASTGSKDKSASTTSSYEEAEVTFSPLLDAQRDSALIELLPEYLTEEITFARDVAAKFYARLADCLMKAV